MLGSQPRISQSKRISDLEAKAKELSRMVAHVSEMNRLCAQMVHTTSKIMALMDENTTRDAGFSDRIAEMNGAAYAKVQQCDAWLNREVPRLKKMTDELLGEK